MDISYKPAESAPVQAQRSFRKRFRLSDQITAYLFLLPALFVFGLFAWFPIVKTIIFSFQKVSLVGESSWVGLSNFQRMLADPSFKIAWSNSITFALLSVGMGFLIPVFVAIMVNEMRRGKVFFRLVYYSYYHFNSDLAIDLRCR